MEETSPSGVDVDGVEMLTYLDHFLLVSRYVDKISPQVYGLEINYLSTKIGPTVLFLGTFDDLVLMQY